MALSLLMTGAAHAIDLFSFSGTVTDPIGRPLAGAAVSDGTKSVTTSASGVYSLSEGSTGTFDLRASRSDTTVDRKTVDVVVPLPTTVNFQVKYLLSAQLNVDAVSTVDGPVSGSLTVTSRAPSPGTPGGAAGTSCVYVTDSRTSSTNSATLVSTSGSTSTWTWPLSIPQDATEGSFTVTAVAKDCSNGTVLSASGLDTYQIDNTAPEVKEILPEDVGNTMYPVQPLLARITDNRAGVKPSSIVFKLTKPNNVVTISGSDVSYNSTTTWARTANQSLLVDNVYKVEVTATDWAGNSVTSTQGTGFLVTTLDLTNAATLAEIPPTACTVTTQGDIALKDVVCDNVPLHLNKATAVLSGSLREGTGGIKQQVSLATAKITPTLHGVPLATLDAPTGDTRWNTATFTMPFSVPAPTRTSATYTAAPLNASLGTLPSKVPSGADGAILSMAPTPTTASAATCADPTTGTKCVPEPVAPVRVPVATTMIPSATPSFYPCNEAISHKEDLVLDAGADASFTVTVDTAKITPSKATMYYTLDGGAVQTSEIVANQSTYTFSIPGASLASGTLVQYSFVVNGTMSDSKCTRAWAASPSNGSFISAAATSADRTIPAVNEAAVLSMVAAQDQPAHLTRTADDATQDDLCNEFYAAPTPCTLFAPPDSSKTPVTQQRPGNDPVPLGGLNSLTGMPGASSQSLSSSGSGATFEIGYSSQKECALGRDTGWFLIMEGNDQTHSTASTEATYSYANWPDDSYNTFEFDYDTFAFGSGTGWVKGERGIGFWFIPSATVTVDLSMMWYYNITNTTMAASQGAFFFPIGDTSAEGKIEGSFWPTFHKYGGTPLKGKSEKYPGDRSGSELIYHRNDGKMYFEDYWSHINNVTLQGGQEHYMYIDVQPYVRSQVAPTSLGGGAEAHSYGNIDAMTMWVKIKDPNLGFTACP